ncbi:11598_t:CDS:1 [Acaulospora colombiana]|uniref:11598_t:CDS:1 n=1 Tax=Acaulospora colombiana TaxID=27376 RepID=A0ACA9KTQ4_9GLOM|nr:11598_t:CDS:1 [Acaulospora colombiana]
MASIKVSYQDTIRRFAVPKTITWLELESNLRTLFSFSPTFSFALSYTDEDGDIITLSSDLELQDILSQTQQHTPLRFTLIPYNKQPKENENNKPVIDQPSQFSTFQQQTMTDEEPSFTPKISSAKGKQKAEPSLSDPDPFIQEEQDNEEQTRPPFIDLAAQFQKVIDQLRPMMEQQPYLIEQANRIMDQILHNIPVNIEEWTQWFNDKIAEAQRNFYNNTNIDAMDEKQTNSTQQQFEESFFNPQNIINNNFVQRMNQAAASIPSRINEWQNGRLMTDETMKEKLELLRSMGFSNDKKNEELLKKYQGNVERVVEILIEDVEYSVVDTEIQMEDFIF